MSRTDSACLVFMEYHVKDTKPCYLIYPKIRESTPQRSESPGTLGKASWWAQLGRIAVPKEYLRAQAEGDNLGDAKGWGLRSCIGDSTEEQVWGDWSYMRAFIYYWDIWWVVGKG